MPRFITILLLFLTFVSSAQLRFQSLSEVLQYADQNSLTIKEGQLYQQQAMNATGQLRNGLRPKINAIGSADYFPVVPSQVVPAQLVGGESGKFTTVQFGMPAVMAGGIEMRLPIINFSQWEQLYSARLEEKQVAYRSKAQQEHLHIQLTQAYYQHVLLQQLLELNRSSQRSLDSVVTIMDKRFAQGIVDPMDLNRIKKLVLENKTTRLHYERMLQENKSQLRAWLRIADTVDVSLVAMNNPLQESIEWDEINVQDRPAYLAAQTGIAVAQKQAQAIKKLSLPRLEFAARYNYQWQFNQRSRVGFDLATVGLRVEVPIVSGLSVKRQQAALSLSMAKLQEQQVLSTLTHQQEQWRLQYKSAVQKKELLQEQCKLATDNLRIATLSLKEGVMEYETYNSVFLEYNTVHASYFQTLSDALLYRILLTKNMKL